MTPAKLPPPPSPEELVFGKADVSVRRVTPSPELRAAAEATKAFDPNQPRDWHGRWGAGGGAPRKLHLAGVRTRLVTTELGLHADTREKYTVPGPRGKPTYTAERKAFHRKVIEDLLAGHASQPPGRRHMLFTAGGPASGKSSGEKYMPVPPDAVEIDQDYFKTKIDEYVRLAKAQDPYASDAAHKEAADMAKAAWGEAQRRGLNMVVQGTGDSGDGNFARRLRAAHEEGYGVDVFYVTVPTAVAQQRAEARAKATGRAVPLAGLRAMHANVSREFLNVQKVRKHLDSVQIWDSRNAKADGSKPPELIAHLQDGRIIADDRTLYDEFLAKAHEDPGHLIQDPDYI